ncbi:ABC transporter permease [Candidatus Contubernalis alkaliaceticus]|uniref:ABC transporter permease n=1 Tax=Candidatus Contubernalis alkaliaceticus TaxID=338645 RepID=UPI001F4C42F8|nr:ABC transporter permease [Candidatus Contubernalis alkalaceticus]UNC91042.1 ABC transporter permease [Candidatus Contubernalis alkalaceticus]
MYIVKNAFKSISRAKGRNFLILIIAFVIAVSACVSLSIRNGADSAKVASLDLMQITAQIGINRQGVLGDRELTQAARNQALGSLEGLSIEEMAYYAGSEYVKEFYYTNTSTLDGSDSLEPVDISLITEETTDETQPFEMPGGNRNFNRMGVQGDFTVIGYSHHNAMTAFINGTSKITEGTVFDESSEELQGVISDELALLNDLEVGDTITLANPNDDEETYEITIIGIYNNSESSVNQSDMMIGFNAASDPANQIYMSSAAVGAILEKSLAIATVEVNEDTGFEFTTALRTQISGTYVFSAIEDYEKFKVDAVSMGLDDAMYTITSSDISAYEQSMLPLENLSKYAASFLVVVLLIGAIILVVFNVFAIRERKYEIGVLAAIGMDKPKISLQFIMETFFVMFVAIVIGAAVGSAVSVPVADVLLESQVTSVIASVETTNENFGGGFQGRFGDINALTSETTEYVSDITASVDMLVMMQLLAIGFLLALISSASAVISILRYEPLEILSNRS